MGEFKHMNTRMVLNSEIDDQNEIKKLSLAPNKYHKENPGLISWKDTAGTIGFVS